MYKPVLNCIFIVFSCTLAAELVEGATTRSKACKHFFNGAPWPHFKGSSYSTTVQLCQTQGSDTTPLYATLYDTSQKIPVYSANKVILDPKKKTHKRPGGYLWKRVASNLCGNSLPSGTIFSAIKTVSAATLDDCERWQAVDNDYYKNGLDLDRGHLSPNSINSRNIKKQWATFTLTNAAPQYSGFNRNLWRVYECITEQAILQLVPNEPVFIITGVAGKAKDQNGKALKLRNRVQVPGSFWKAVCYPGNRHQNKPAWGYAITKNNDKIVRTPSASNYMTLKEFSRRHFDDAPFSPECLRADFGKFEELVFPNFSKFITTHCTPSWQKKKVMDELIEELFYY